MFKNYIASQTDLETIEEGLKTVWRPELNFVFRKKELIASTVAVSYDSKYLYLWIPLRGKPGQYRLQRIPHNLTIPQEYQRAWYAGLWEGIEEHLPVSIRKSPRFVTPRIGGGLFTPFVTLQKSYKLKANPYTTRESYLATIIHEFGHVYWSQHKLWWFSNKQDNLQIIKAAAQLYEKRSKTPKVDLGIPSIAGVSELFACCAEYCVSQIFWPKHKINFDLFAMNRLEKLMLSEKKKDLGKEDSVLEPSKNPHDFAIVYCKIILTLYPNQWPKMLTSRLQLGL